MASRYLFLLLLALPLAQALVVVNSLDGRDVISALYYAIVKNDSFVFLPPAYNLNVTMAKIGTGKDIFLIESAQHPVVKGLKDILESYGNSVTLYISTDPMETNLDLARRANAKAFVVVDTAYGYNAVAVLAYAKLKGMYLLFADEGNAERVANFLSTVSPREVLIYGYVDEAVKEALENAGIAYDEINTGDKFEDNIEVLELYFSLRPEKRQVILADGSFLEDTMAVGEDPVLFIGKRVPDFVYNYLRSLVARGQVKVALLLDQNYLVVAQSLKERINRELGEDAFSVILKFGIALPTQPGQMLPLEIFPLPSPKLGVEVVEVTYNRERQALEVLYNNTGNVPQYVKASLKVLVDGQYLSTVGDDEAFFLPRGEMVGRSYPIEIEEGAIFVNGTVLYGLSPHSLEDGIVVEREVGYIAFVDKSNLSIEDIYHDSLSGDLYALYRNTGPVELYFKPYVKELSLEMPVEALQPGEARMVRFPKAYRGDVVTVGALYGAREGFLEKKVEMAYSGTFPWWWLLLLLLLLLLYYLYRRWRQSQRKERKGRAKEGKAGKGGRKTARTAKGNRGKAKGKDKGRKGRARRGKGG